VTSLNGEDDEIFNSPEVYEKLRKSLVEKVQNIF
jgi:hypothetical protein